MIVALALLAQLHCAAPVRREHANALFAFRVTLPCGVLENRPLAAALRWRMDADRRRAVAEARRAQARARRQRYPYNRYSLGYDWIVEGSTAQLISLSAEVTRYEGGGHAEDEVDVVIWDTTRGRAVRLGLLFDDAALRRLGSRYCRLWRARDGASCASESCPAIAPAMAAPADSDGNGRFDTLRVFHASSIYSEGRQRFDLPFEPEDLARVPDAFRPAFEVAGERIRPLPEGGG